MLIFLHGFPETAYLAWNKQIEYFSNMGYFVVAPDQRGYNNRYVSHKMMPTLHQSLTGYYSAKFDSFMDYHLDYLSQDVLDLMDHYGRESASVRFHCVLDYHI